MKEYELKTFKEVLEVVDEKNIKCFLEDFSNWLAMSVAIKKVASKHVKVKNNEVFKWIDDGKNDLTVIINVKTKQS